MGSRCRGIVRERERAQCFPVIQKHLLNLCTFVLDSGILGSQTAIITSGCQHDTLSCRGMPAGTSGQCECVHVHIPLLRLICTNTCLGVGLSVKPVCSSLTEHTSPSCFITTAKTQQITIAPAVLFTIYQSICDTGKLEFAGPNWHFDSNIFQVE